MCTTMNITEEERICWSDKRAIYAEGTPCAREHCACVPNTASGQCCNVISRRVYKSADRRSKRTSSKSTQIFCCRYFVSWEGITQCGTAVMFCHLREHHMGQDKQCTYNVTQRRVRATIVAVEKQWVLRNLCVCVFCSLSYPACAILSFVACPLFNSVV
jgi:hypothetical protein